MTGKDARYPAFPAAGQTRRARPGASRGAARASHAPVRSTLILSILALAMLVLSALALSALPPFAGEARAQTDDRAERRAARKEILVIPDAPAPAAPLPAPQEQADEPEGPKTAAAIRYFNRCTESVMLEQEFDTRALFCSCSADKARELLSTAQMEALAEGRGGGVDDTLFYTQVQTPCLSYPVAEIEYRRCLFHNGNVFVTQEAHNGMCKCLSAGIADFVRTYGPDLMAMLLKKKPESEPPLRTLSRSRPYRVEYQKRKTACLNQFSYQ